MSSLLVFVFSLLTLHPMPTRGDNVPAYYPLNFQAKRALLGDRAPMYTTSDPTNKGNPACVNCAGSPYSVDTCGGGNCNRGLYSESCRGNCRGDKKPASDPLNLQEKQALLSFINKVPHSSSLNWTDSKFACSWEGVTCSPSGNNVLYLRLPLKNLTGEIPPDTIGKLTSLRVLSLDHNRLSGTIPSDFSNLHYLTTLYLNLNNFSGNIPSSFSTLSYLTILRLDNNNFSGTLPDMIKAKDLTTFDVSYNKLVGPIPRSLSYFPKDAFSNNSNLCGPPLAPCNASYLSPKSDGEQDDTSTPKRHASFGIFSGSTMMLLIFLGSVGKNMYKYIRPTSENKKLVTFGDDVFELEDLLKTTVEDLGEGSVGTSYKQVHVGKNKTVVLKILKDVVTEEEFKAKMDVLGKIKNSNVVPLRAYYNYSNDEKWLVYDYMPTGSLSARLQGSVGSIQTQLNRDHRMQIALSAAKGLAYLHVVEKIVHGNITSTNIFFQQETNNEVSLSDYGLITLFLWVRKLPEPLGHRLLGPGSSQDREFTFESDVYSFGVLLLELLTGKIPNHASLDKEGVHVCDWVGSIVGEEAKVELFNVELTRDHNIDKMVQLAKSCVLIEPNQRPPMCNVVSMMEDICQDNHGITTQRGYDDSVKRLIEKH